MIKGIVKILLLFSFSLLYSCDSDCKQVKIEKAEWITRYENYSVDTLASYSIIKDSFCFTETYSNQIQNLNNSYNDLIRQIRDLSSRTRNISNDDVSLKDIRDSYRRINFSGYNSVNRYIEIRNNSDFSASFAVGDNAGFYQYGTNEYQTIPPNESVTFLLSKSIYWKSSHDFNFNDNITILQEKQKISLIRRIDELYLSTDTINTCEHSVEALEMKYQVIKDLYNEKVDTQNRKIIKNEKQK